jgi:hypothetical protein
MGILKIGREIGAGTSFVQRVLDASRHSVAGVPISGNEVRAALLASLSPEQREEIDRQRALGNDFIFMPGGS